MNNCATHPEPTERLGEMLSIFSGFLAVAIGYVVGHIAGVSDYKNDHSEGGFFYEQDRLKRGEFKRGVESAADVVRAYNSSSTHDYDLGDCILAKLNQLPSSEIRKNKRRLKVFRN